MKSTFPIQKDLCANGSIGVCPLGLADAGIVEKDSSENDGRFGLAVSFGRFAAEESWMPEMDLNHDTQIQSLLCCRYTIGQYGTRVKN